MKKFLAIGFAAALLLVTAVVTVGCDHSSNKAPQTEDEVNVLVDHFNSERAELNLVYHINVRMDGQYSSRTEVLSLTAAQLQAAHAMLIDLIKTGNQIEAVSQREGRTRTKEHRQKLSNGVNDARGWDSAIQNQLEGHGRHRVEQVEDRLED